MDTKWFDRDLVDRSLDGVDFKVLKYDQDTGQYCLDGEPFTGVTKTSTRSGKLRGVTHLVKGVDEGISVAWYESGQLELYSEMAGDVYHGWHIEWNEDGTQRVKQHYTNGRLDKMI